MRSRSTNVRIARSDWEYVQRCLFTGDGNENAIALLCGLAFTDNEELLLVRSVLPVPAHEYRARLPYHLEVSPAFFNTVVDRCLAADLTPVIAHSHPNTGEAHYSLSDDEGERRLHPVLVALLPGARPTSLLVTNEQLAGRRYDGRHFSALRELTITGQRGTAIPLTPRRKPRYGHAEEWNRQILAFGPEGQHRIQSLRVSIVGAGGTGSSVAEQLARIGVANITLIDPDRIEISNVSRLYGTSRRDIGRHKVRAIQKHLRRLGAVEVTAITDTAIRQSVIEKLRDADLVFSCVDNDRTRALLNRFAYQYLVPVIDVGVRLDARNGTVTAAAGRVSIAGSDFLCLRCSHHIDPERIRAESLPDDERKQLTREGYVMGIDEPAPAVVSFNTTVAGLAVTAGLNLFVPLTGADQPADQLYDATSGVVFTAEPRHQQGCDVCDPDTGVKARGDSERVSAYD